jgi:hypothetical protein
MADIRPQSPPENSIIALFDRERHYLLKKDATVFSHPRGVRILTPPDGNQVKVSIPTAIETFWMLASIAIFFLASTIISTGLGLSYAISIWGQWGEYFSLLPLIFSIVITLALSWVIWRLCFPRIIIEANREGVMVGKYKFDWRALGSFRTGYTAGGEERENIQFFYQGLFIEYGPYGFDLPYMVRKYYAAHYVLWLNEMLDTIGQDDHLATHDPKSGFKKSVF